MADTAGRAAEAILDVPVGGVVRAIDPHRRVGRDDTIADVSRDPYLRERVRDSVGGLSVAMQDIMAQVAVLAPELRRSMAGLENNMDRAIRDSRARRHDRDYDRRYDDDYRYDR